MVEYVEVLSPSIIGESYLPGLKTSSPFILQSYLGIYPSSQIDSVLKILCRCQDQFGKRNISRVKVKAAAREVRIKELLFQPIGKKLHLDYLSGINERLKAQEFPLEIRSHFLLIVVRVLKGQDRTSKINFTPPLGYSLLYLGE